MRASATVYQHPSGPVVGMTIEGTASVTLTELHQLIDYLVALSNHAKDPDKYSEPPSLVG